ncbi:ABC transporter substrate-binding protein [Dongia soli]|uniref:ABC transporter substrate-binding protein n=1 Tax=Dongia soli TaxID=600628 RepID=A0ABU5EEL2_9PROT|nr:ABC transporter substrate-binding protein [Dongia soli]MDY0884464.1 ABC transporter substrate-binding protein [Dongia soli]
MITLGAQVFNGFVRFDRERRPQPDLIESWEVKPGASEWIMNIRSGITFHDGRSLTPDDIIYSLNLHRGKSTSAMVGQMKHVQDITKLSDHQISVKLSRPDAEFIYVLGDFHMRVVADGFKDWSKPIGTGAFKYDSFTPGIRARTVRNADYWRTDGGFVDVVETTVINDTAVRMNALVAGQVDIINRVGKTSVELLNSGSGLKVEKAPTGWHAIMAARMDAAPFDNPDFRLALKYAIDRKALLKTLFNNYGTVGNDHPVPENDPNYNSELPQIAYDLDRAKFHLKKANLGSSPIELTASDAAYEGAVSAAEIYQASAAKAGLDMALKREPIDGFWSNAWLKRPFCESYWAGRSSALQMLSIAYKSDATWNETAWKDQAFDKLLTDASAELDDAKRKHYLWEAQRLLHENGGAVIPVFAHVLEAHSGKVKGYQIGGINDLFNGHIPELVWLDS